MSWRRMRSEAQKALADAPNGFSIAKRRKAIEKGKLGQKAWLRIRIPKWAREYAFANGRHAAEMTMQVYSKPAIVLIDPTTCTTRTWWEGRRHYTEVRDREGHLVRRDYKDFQ